MHTLCRAGSRFILRSSAEDWGYLLKPCRQWSPNAEGGEATKYTKTIQNMACVCRGKHEFLIVFNTMGWLCPVCEKLSFVLFCLGERFFVVSVGSKIPNYSWFNGSPYLRSRLYPWSLVASRIALHAPGYCFTALLLFSTIHLLSKMTRKNVYMKIGDMYIYIYG